MNGELTPFELLLLICLLAIVAAAIRVAFGTIREDSRAAWRGLKAGVAWLRCR